MLMRSKLPDGWDQHKTECEEWMDSLERGQWKTDLACTLVAVGACLCGIASIMAASWLAWWWR